MRRLRLGDKILRVRDEPEPAPDPKRGPVPLLCLHGAGMSSVVWMEVVRRLAPARRVIAPDLPGHGQSDSWPTGTDAASRLLTYRDAVGAMATQLGVGRTVLVGHSMGGAVALAYALAWPERVAGLVLVNSAAELPVAPEFLDLLTRTLPSEDAEGKAWADRLPGELADLFFSPATPKDGRERWQAMLLAATPQTVRGDFLACGSFDVRERLGELKLPTLLIGGQDDLMVPPQAVAATAAKIAGSKLHMVPDTAHLTHLEQPEQFLSLLAEFLPPLT